MQTRNCHKQIEYCVPCKGVIHLWGFSDFKVAFPSVLERLLFYISNSCEAIPGLSRVNGCAHLAPQAK